MDCDPNEISPPVLALAGVNACPQFDLERPDLAACPGVL